MKVKKFSYTFLFPLIFILFSLFACVDDKVGESYYTFTGETIYSYLQKDSLGEFSEVVKAIDKAGLKGVFSSYGTYTFFAPTNDAMQAYYAKHGTSFEAITGDSLKEMLYYHLLNVEYLTEAFVEGLLPTKNFNDRYINVSFSAFSSGKKIILVNQNSSIVDADLETHNGVIHAVGSVLEPSDMFLAEKIEAAGYYSIFYKALIETGLADSLKLVEDEKYIGDQLVTAYNGAQTNTVSSRVFGYTALVESDSVFANEGINSFDELVVAAKEKYVELYGQEEPSSNFTDRENSLNLFVAYHLLEVMADANGLVDNYYKTFHSSLYNETSHVEYIPTMRNRSLLEAKTGNKINQQSDGTYVGLSSDATRINVDCWNGIYHEINKVLWYDKTVEDDVLNKRLRIDFGSLNPEMTNNGLRPSTHPSSRWVVQNGYFKYTSLGSDANVLLHFMQNNGWAGYQGGYIAVNGWYDIVVQTPPLPPGTWEIRLGVSTYSGAGYSKHGLAQLYFDGNPLGIPMNFALDGTNALIGWIADADTDDEGAANDRAMRNRGWMKAPDVYGDASGTNARNIYRYLRRIIATINVGDNDRDKPHFFRAKALETTLFEIDYFEFVPKSALENEDKH